MSELAFFMALGMVAACSLAHVIVLVWRGMHRLSEALHSQRDLLADSQYRIACLESELADVRKAMTGPYR